VPGKDPRSAPPRPFLHVPRRFFPHSGRHRAPGQTRCNAAARAFFNFPEPCRRIFRCLRPLTRRIVERNLSFPRSPSPPPQGSRPLRAIRQCCGCTWVGFKPPLFWTPVNFETDLLDVGILHNRPDEPFRDESLFPDYPTPKPPPRFYRVASLSRDRRKKKVTHLS